MTRSSDTRTEHDSFGPIEVPRNALWGAQTQRALHHFPAGDRMPLPLVHAIARVKGAAARVNLGLGLLDARLAQAIGTAADEVVAGQHDDHFPLPVWQTGSGTQTNMNVNEVLANRAAELLGLARGSRAVHPNDHVNRGQSSNDVIPTAMHVALALALARHLLPSLDGLRATLSAKSQAFEPIVKIGRTHLQDATPITLGQEFSGYVAQLDFARQAAESGLAALYPLGHRRHRGRHRTRHASGIRRARRRGAGARNRPALHAGRKPVRRARSARRRCFRPRRAEDTGRGAVEDRQRRALAMRAARAPDWASCPFQKTSRAARSCPARSTQPRANRC